MPTATAKYSFEYKISDWANQFSHRLTGETRGFVMVFAPGGAVREIHFGHQEERKPPNFEALLKDNASYLLYDPFEGPVYTYICWQNVEQVTIERIIGQTFAADDLVRISQKGDALGSFPATWDVMF